MRSEFCNWYSNSKDKSASSAFAAGWQHQQSKVDELQGQLNFQSTLMKSKNSMIDQLESSNNELQKRLDELEKVEFKLAQVKAILQNSKSLLESILVKKLEQALKGGSDANQ